MCNLRIIGLAFAFIAITTDRVPARAGELYVVTTGGSVGTFTTTESTYSPIGSLGVGFEWWGGIAYDANSGTLYGVDGYQTTNLYTIDTSTGKAETVGSHEVANLRGLAFDSNGQLYGSQFQSTSNPPNAALVTLDSGTGSASPVGPFEHSLGIGALAWDSSREMLVGWYEFENDFFEIDPTTGEALLPVLLDEPRNASNLGDLTYDPDLDLFWGVDLQGWLFIIDPKNGYARTNVFNLSTILDPFQDGAPIGVAYIVAPGNDNGSSSGSQGSGSHVMNPEPASLATFGVAGLTFALSLARRRRELRA